ncbi:ATP-binding protein [Microbispora sp. NPDC049125]|uniref:ATP-binding protein n=1 Tax=Microbispora sp. NPDC049125 TaxID=3154929 RepID=UPI0034665A99
MDPLIEDIFGTLPAIMLVGPRATGKTTTAARHVRTVIRLDREQESAAFLADPDAALRRLPEPVLLDEWQMVPEVLGAVKRAVDDDHRPGRFILTGSVWSDFGGRTWPGTGRVVRVDMAGLSVKEAERTTGRPPFADLLAQGRVAELTVPARPPDLGDYLDLALRSGYPEAHRMPPAVRDRWLDSYIEQTLTRDIETLDGRRDPLRLRAYLEALALNTAGVVTDKTLYEAAAVNARTGEAYERLLRDLLLLDKIPAWFSNRLKRLVRGAKRYVVEPALVPALLRVGAEGIMRDGDLLGRMIDTFVAQQLRAEMPVCASRPRMYHLRQDRGRHEVDIVLELGMGQVIGIEVKASAAPRADAAKHLAWLRDELGDRFVAGVVLHTGARMYELGDRIVAAPICTVWS